MVFCAYMQAIGCAGITLLLDYINTTKLKAHVRLQSGLLTTVGEHRSHFPRMGTTSASHDSNLLWLSFYNRNLIHGNELHFHFLKTYKSWKLEVGGEEYWGLGFVNDPIHQFSIWKTSQGLATKLGLVQPLLVSTSKWKSQLQWADMMPLLFFYLRTMSLVYVRQRQFTCILESPRKSCHPLNALPLLGCSYARLLVPSTNVSDHQKLNI